MKLVFEKDDVYKTLGSLNDKTFMAASYANSQEAWGLPTFRRLRFKKEADIWKDSQVNAALDAVKRYAQAKGWKIATPAQCKNDARGLFAYWSHPDAIAKGTTADCYNPKMVTAKGVTLATSTATFKTALKDTRNLIKAHSTVAAGIGLGTALVGGSLGSVGLMIGGVLGQALSRPTGALLVALTYQGHAALMISYVPFIKPNGKIVWKKFGFFLIGEYKDSKTSAESLNSQSLEADNEDVNVDMNDLVNNAECPIEDAGKDSVTVDVSDISESEAAHNEEASAGGVVISEQNADDLTMDPVAATEALIESCRLGFSLEDLDNTADELANAEIPVETPDTTPETDDLTMSGVDVTALDDAAAKVADLGDTNVAANVIPGEVVDTSTEALGVELLGWDL